MKEKIFGNKSEFGIRYIPGYKSKDGKSFVATLHLLLGGQLIGSKGEVCLVGTWIHCMELNLKLLTEDFNKLYDDEFDNKSDLEIFELIYKSNQLEDEYSSDYLHLPVLSNDIWGYCNFTLDETIDSYLITVINIQNQIKFIWKGTGWPCPEQHINKLYSVTIDRKHLIAIITECLDFVKNDLLNYSEETPS